MSINDEWNSVKLFHEKFDHPVSNHPVKLDNERVIKRFAWMLEEIEEFRVADNIVEQADAMIDVIYFALGTLVEMGIEPKILFDIVQDANMSKLWEDGKPHYAEDGKTIKPKNWIDPHSKLALEIEMMLNNEG